MKLSGQRCRKVKTLIIENRVLFSTHTNKWFNNVSIHNVLEMIGFRVYDSLRIDYYRGKL